MFVAKWFKQCIKIIYSKLGNCFQFLQYFLIDMKKLQGLTVISQISVNLYTQHVTGRHEIAMNRGLLWGTAGWYTFYSVQT
jgi:hypothetical protein